MSGGWVGAHKGNRLVFCDMPVTTTLAYLIHAGRARNLSHMLPSLNMQVMTDYRVKLQYGTFGEADMCNYTVNIYDNGDGMRLQLGGKKLHCLACYTMRKYDAFGAHFPIHAPIGTAKASTKSYKKQQTTRRGFYTLAFIFKSSSYRYVIYAFLRSCKSADMV